MTFSVRKEEGLEDIPFRCGRGVGEEEMERMEGGFECQLSDHTVCDPCICSFKGGISLPSATVTALSPRLRPHLLSPCPSTLFSPQVNSQTDTISNPSVTYWS